MRSALFNQSENQEMLEHSALASCTKLLKTANLCRCLVCWGEDEMAKLILRQRKGLSQHRLRLLQKWYSVFS